MIEIGKKNKLKVLREVPFGVYLGDQDGEEDVLLPKKQVPSETATGDEIEVFVYKDSEDRIIATTQTPKACRDECAYLQVKEITHVGAFLDWGLEKDLLVPFREQIEEMIEGQFYVVYILLENTTRRLIASSKIRKHLDGEISVREGEQVDLLVEHVSDLGLQAIINDRHIGLLYHDEIFKPLQVGDRVQGYIKKIRSDGKIDVSLQKQGYAQIESSEKLLLAKLEESQGFLPLTDKSDPAEIRAHLQMSKKVFKKTVGALFKKRLILIQTEGISLNQDN